MKKVIILRKIQVTMKTFAPPFFNQFSLNLNRKKHVVMKAMRKKRNVFKLQLSNYWCECGHCKNEAREIDCLCCRKVDAMLIAAAKIPKSDGSISPSSFYVNCPTTSHTC